MNNRNEMSSISVDDFVFVDIIYCEKLGNCETR